jgi:TonB family protein
MSLAGAADDAPAYLDQIERRIMAAWKLPLNANGLKVFIRLRLERSGRVSDVRVEKSSGDKQFDASAVQAVRRASPFPPVPKSAQSSLVGDRRMVLDPTQPPAGAGQPDCLRQPMNSNVTRQKDQTLSACLW